VNPSPKRLADLLQAADLPAAGATGGHCWVTGVSDDSRRVQPGDLFVAVPGATDRSSEHARHAASRGAAAVLAQSSLEVGLPTVVVTDARRALAAVAAAFYDRPTTKLFTIGVTGTNGKTTVCRFIAQLFGERRTARIDTVTNAATDPLALTTPTSPTIQHVAWQAVQDGKTHLVVEASSAGLAQHRLDQVAFDVAVFTNLSYDHMDVHPTWSEYVRAKVSLFERLPPSGLAVVNRDDPEADAFRRATRARVATFGFAEDADVTARCVRASARSTDFVLGYRRKSTAVVLPIPGPFVVASVLAAACTALSCDLSWDEVVSRLPELRAPAGRVKRFTRIGGPDAVVDFAHNPDGLDQVLRWLRATYPRVTVVFGCPGDADREKRMRMGSVASEWADAIVVTSDNPKRENPDAIARDILKGIESRSVSVELDRRAAVAAAVRQTPSAGVVLLAGKGHEVVQRVGDRATPYSDEDTLRALGYTEDVGEATA